DQILIVIERRLVTEIVATGDDHAVVGKRIYHENFVVNNRESCVQNFFLPTLGNDSVQCFGCNDARVLFHRRLLSLGLLGLSCALELIIETFRRGNVGHATANEKILVLPKRLRGPIRDAWRSGIKREKQDCMFSAIDSLNERFHVDRTLLILLWAAGFRRIWREPTFNRIAAELE